jgi:transcriptional regulator with XRE-family HTH domain
LGEVRASKGLSQADLAERAGVSRVEDLFQLPE